MRKVVQRTIECPFDDYFTAECHSDLFERSKYRCTTYDVFFECDHLYRKMLEWCEQRIQGDFKFMAKVKLSKSPVSVIAQESRWFVRFTNPADAVLFKMKWL